jgi:hypothetical protein
MDFNLNGRILNIDQLKQQDISAEQMKSRFLAIPSQGITGKLDHLAFGLCLKYGWVIAEGQLILHECRNGVMNAG